MFLRKRHENHEQTKLTAYTIFVRWFSYFYQCNIQKVSFSTKSNNQKYRPKEWRWIWELRWRRWRWWSRWWWAWWWWSWWWWWWWWWWCSDQHSECRMPLSLDRKQLAALHGPILPRAACVPVGNMMIDEPITNELGAVCISMIKKDCLAMFNIIF